MCFVQKKNSKPSNTCSFRRMNLSPVLILAFIAAFFAPASPIPCYNCPVNRNITCRLDYRTPDWSFSRYECILQCDTTINCTTNPNCLAIMTKILTEDSYKANQICQRVNFNPNATCATTDSRHFPNSGYIHQLFTQDYVNTSHIPVLRDNFPYGVCGCNTSYCNDRILISFTHDPIPVGNCTNSTCTPVFTNSTPDTFPTNTSTSTPDRNSTFSPPFHIPEEYLAYIGAGVLVLALLLASLIICPLALWRCCRKNGHFSSYKLANEKPDASGHEMATLSSPAGFHEDPELARVPILTDLKLEDLIGSGKYGHVWRCVYEGREMACKVWLPCEINAWRSERAIFSQETTYHPNIVKYLHSGFIEERSEDGFVGVLLMELCGRGSLSNFLETCTPSWDVASRFAYEIASGIGYLHSHTGMLRGEKGYTQVPKCPIAHRDIKSSNVLIRSNMTCCISDLGLAMALNPNNSGASVSTAHVGTPFYMAPEALAARINLSDLDSFKQMDVFSMGLVLWEIFSRCEVEGGPPVFSEHKIPFSDVHRSLLQSSRVSRVQLILELKELHELPIEQLLPVPISWKQHPLLSKARQTILDCTYKEPEARVTAGIVAGRFQANVIKNNYSEQDLKFGESFDFGSFASMSSLVRMAESQRLSRINCDNYTKLPEYSV